MNHSNVYAIFTLGTLEVRETPNESKTRPHERQRELLRSMASILGEDLTFFGWMS